MLKCLREPTVTSIDRESSDRYGLTLLDSVYLFAAFSIKCWECRSDSDPKCADPFDNSTLSITDCRQVESKEHLPGVRATMCRKIRQKGKKFTSFLKNKQLNNGSF